WVDEWGGWTGAVKKKADAGQGISVDLLIGVDLLQAAASRAKGVDGRKLSDAAAKLKDVATRDRHAAVTFAQNSDLASLVNRNRNRDAETKYDKDLTVVVDPVKARFSAWYELLTRSVTNDRKKPGTLRDCIGRRGYTAGMGFDVLYLPPIHPIGLTERKGRNNSTTPASGDFGSPWAIGAIEGGHKAIHP